MKIIYSKIIFVILIMVLLSACEKEDPVLLEKVKPYKEFLDKGHLNPKDYIFNLFEKYDIVIISEKWKSESTQWDFISELVSDDRFIATVGNIFTEYGPLNYQVKADSLLTSGELSADKRKKLSAFIMQNLSAWPVELNTGYYDFLQKIYSKNLGLEKDDKIRLWFCDDPFEWDQVTDVNYSVLFKEYMMQKDLLLAERISSKFRKAGSAKNGKKALVVLYHSNAFKKPLEYDNGRVKEGTGVLLANKYPGKTAMVLLNNTIDNLKGGWLKINDGLWDAAFEQNGNLPAGFDFEGSPFGEDVFDQSYYSKTMKSKFLYKNIYDGFVFYRPLVEDIVSIGYSGLLEGFEEEYLRRSNCIGNAFYKEVNENIIPAFRKNEIITKKPDYSLTQTDELKYYIYHPVFWVMVLLMLSIVYLLGKKYKRG